MLRVKSASTETFLFQIAAVDGGSVSNTTAYATVSSTWGTNSVTFELEEAQLKKLKIGQHYKIQLAYIDNIAYEIGYFSTVSIIKYTGRPSVSIVNFDSNTANENPITVLGNYSNALDYSEKDAEYRFILYEGDKTTVLDDTGWLTHIAANDVEQQEDGTAIKTLVQTDKYTIKYLLDSMSTYFIRYMVKTNNELITYSPYYELVETGAMNSTLQANLIAELDYDNGCIILKLVPFQNIEDTIIVGSFEIGRASALEDFKIWTIIEAFNMNGHLADDGHIFIDFTIEQGQLYKYAIRQKNANDVYSSWIPITKWRIKRPESYFDDEIDDWNYSAVIAANFEDAFLYDGEKQLKIRFNPKVQQFKTVLSEGKKTAIGNQYPYFFRNGIVSYKEFNISGLISYLSDQDEYFVSRTKDLGMDSTWEDSTDITDENLVYERRFKLAVLDWLNKDNIKLFKSPSEGNYLVHLSNVSLSPEDALSRMIHNFTCTATEICEFNTDNLVKENFLNNLTLTYEQTLFITSEIGQEKKQIHSSTVDLFRGFPGFYIKMEDFLPGSEFTVGGKKIVIGSTGQYEVSFTEPLKVLKITSKTITENIKYGKVPTVTVGIYAKGFTSFDLVTKVQGKKHTYIHAAGNETEWGEYPNLLVDNYSPYEDKQEYSIMQRIGELETTLLLDPNFYTEAQKKSQNILEPYFDLKHEIERLYYIKLSPRPLVDGEISLDALQAYVNKANSRTNKFIDIDVNSIYRLPISDKVITWLNELYQSDADRYRLVGLTEADYDGYIYIGIEFVDGEYKYNISSEYSTKVIYGKKENYYRNKYGQIETEYLDNIIDVAHTTMLSYSDLDYIPVDENREPYIVLGNGVMADFGLYQKVISYNIESEDFTVSDALVEDLKEAKEVYELTKTRWFGTADKDYIDGATYRYYFASPATLTTEQYQRRKISYIKARLLYMEFLNKELEYQRAKALGELQATSG